MNTTLPGFILDDDQAPALRMLACHEEPQARIESFGASAVSDSELLAMLLQGAGVGPADALDGARQLLASAGNLLALASWAPARFQEFPDIGCAKSCQLVAAIELGRRLLMAQTSGTRPLLNEAGLVAAYLAPIAIGLEVEKFWVGCLDRKNRLLRLVECSSGTATTALVHPREVFRIAVREGACAIVCAHNHPSGDPAPSAADMQVTRLLREAARIVDICLVDHVIVGRAGLDPLGKGFFSFREAGII